MSGETVLIVHDRRDYIEFLMTRVLSPKGVTVLIAQNGEQARRKALDMAPDLIILNADMAGGGLSLLEHLREQGCSSAVILVTRQGSLEGAVQAMRCGAQDYITRPDDDEVMRRAVRRALLDRQARRQAMLVTPTERHVEHEIHDMRVVSAVGRRLLSTLEWEKLLPRIVDAAVYLTAAGEGSLSLVNEATGELRVLAVKGLGEEEARYLQPQPVKRESIIKALKSGQPVRGYSRTDPKLSYLHVPITVGDVVIGVISTGQKAEGRPFDDHDVNLLTGLREYAVIAIHNARAYRAMEELAQQRAAPPSEPEAAEVVEASPEALLQLLQTQGQQVREGLHTAAQLAQELRQQVALVESLAARLDAQEQVIERFAARLSAPATVEEVREEKSEEPPPATLPPDALLQEVLECLGEGILVSDASDQVLLANSAAARILQKPVEKLVGQSLAVACADPRWSKTYLILKAAARLGPEEPGSEIEVVETPLTINEHIVYAVFAPLLRAPGEWQGAVTVLRDVSEEQMERRWRDEFIATISRDLQTPMTAIMGYADLMLEQSIGALNETQGHFLQRIKANTKRMVNMLRDLIGVATIESGALAVSPEPIEIAPILEEVLTEIQPQLTDKDLTLEQDVPDDLPLALADPGAVHHVLTHLLANAYKCSVVGGRVAVSIRVCGAEELGSHAGELERAMVISVTDSGGGIAPEDEDKVFRRHYGERVIVPGLGETGVELSIARGLVEAHGGKMWLESHMGQGTTFTFTLPLTEAESPSEG